MSIFKIISLQGNETIKLMALDHFSQAFSAQNENCSVVGLRKYQSYLLSGISPTMISPCDGSSLVLGSSISIGRNSHWYGYCNIITSEELWISSGSIREGYPLIGAVLLSKINDPKETLLAYCGDKKVDRRLALLQRMAAIFISRRKNIHINWKRPVKYLLVIGHPNFAHHVWNELSGLDSWIESVASSGPILAKVLHEPLGNVSDIFPELEFKRDTEKFYLDDLPDTSYKQVAFRIGSIVLSQSMKNRILKITTTRRTYLLDGLSTCIASDRIPIWITVRLRNRTATNLYAFHKVLIQALLGLSQQITIVIDGFSYPCDQQNNPNFCLREKAIEEYISRLLCDLGKVYPISGRIYSVNGLNLLDVINIAGHARFYIAHAGTVQHKIGWFHNIPGIIMAPANAKLISRWYTRCVEGAIAPFTMSEDFICAESTEKSSGSLDKDRMYHIDNIDGAVHEIINMIKNNISMG